MSGQIRDLYGLHKAASSDIIDIRRGDDQGPGIIRTLSGRLVNLRAPKWEDIDIQDIAWSISKQIRYNGHIPYDYTVARHSIIMSYFVPPEYAMEALLHDAGEAYCGDIIYPIKRMFPELDDFEDRITGIIMSKYNFGKSVEKETVGTLIYRKSDVISHADKLIAQHECHRFGRPGQYILEMSEAENRAGKAAGLCSLYESNVTDKDRDAYLNRFYALNPGCLN